MNKMSLLSIISLILIFLGGIGAILLTISQSINSLKDKTEIIENTKIENRDLKIQLKEIRNERDTLNKNLEKRDINIKNQNDIIISLNQKLAEQSEYIQNYVTGGKGFPELSILYYEDKNEKKFFFRTANNFELPIYNIIIQVFDQNCIDNSLIVKEGFEKPFLKMSDYQKSRIFNYNLVEIPPNEIRSVEKFYPLKEGRFYVKLQARNQSLIEKLVIVQIDNQYYYGFQIFDSKGNLIKQSFDDKLKLKIRKALLHELNQVPLSMNFNFTE